MSDQKRNLADELLMIVLFTIWTGIVLFIGYVIGINSTLGKINRGELTPTTNIVVSTNIVWGDKK